MCRKKPACKEEQKNPVIRVISCEKTLKADGWMSMSIDKRPECIMSKALSSA